MTFRDLYTRFWWYPWFHIGWFLWHTGWTGGHFAPLYYPLFP
jgi:hypothetical protein